MTFRTNEGAFTLIETLVGSAIFIVVALAGYKAFGVLMDAVTSSQAKIAGTSVANEKIEIIRNLPYTDVGIVAGLPPGKIQRNETVVRDNYIFNVLTTIRSVDDPFDGTIGGNPSDTSPADYKLVDLAITCTNCKVFNTLNFTTLVAPHALETASTNGALFIHVIDSRGLAVTGASVHIVNNQTNPHTIIDETTDNGGWVKIVDAPPGTNAYSITVTKTGYNQDQTYPPGGAAGASPNNPDATVILQHVTQASFSIDRLSSLAVSTVDVTCDVLPNIGFSLAGTKTIGNGILKYPTQNFTTNGTGSYAIPNIEWDRYKALLTSLSYDLKGAIPSPIFDINPNENDTLTMITIPHVNGALLVSVVDADGNPINSASVRLQKSPFDQTKTTTNVGACATPGQVFWNGLSSGSYTMTVSAAGYTTTASLVTMTTAWQRQTIDLSPQ